MFLILAFFVATKVHLNSLFFILINCLNFQDWIYCIWIVAYTSLEKYKGNSNGLILMV